MRFILLILLPVFMLAACETRPTNTSQPIFIDIVGVDGAYCTLSTPHNRYAVHAPGQVKVERSIEDLKVDCKGNAGRRRVVTVASEFTDIYYRYPEIIVIDFSAMNHGTRYNGFRVEPSRYDKNVREIITEDSFSAPIETTQGYPVSRTHAMAGGSNPIPLN